MALRSELGGCRMLEMERRMSDGRDGAGADNRVSLSSGRSVGADEEAIGWGELSVGD